MSVWSVIGSSSLSGAFSNCVWMISYVIVDATEPKIAAIRGLAPGPLGFARLGISAAQPVCLCHGEHLSLHAAVCWYQDELMCLHPTAMLAHLRRSPSCRHQSL